MSVTWRHQVVERWRTASRVELGVWIVCGLGLIMLLTLICATVRDALLGAPLAASKDLMAPVVAATGVIIAVMAFARDRGKIERDRAEARSKILYEQSKQGLETVYALLKDQNNERSIWLRAARLLRVSQNLGRTIQSEEYRMAYDLVEEDVRARLYEALTLEGRGKARDGLPVSFFFGVSSWKGKAGLPLFYLASSTAPSSKDASAAESEHGAYDPSMNLQEASVKVVLDFLRFPSDYKDPLIGVELTQIKHWCEKFAPAVGAREYLIWKSENYVENGKVVKKEPSVDV